MKQYQIGELIGQVKKAINHYRLLKDYPKVDWYKNQLKILKKKLRDSKKGPNDQQTK